MSQSKGNSTAAFSSDYPALGSDNPSLKGRVNEVLDGESSPSIDQLNHGMANINIDSVQESGWEVIAKKSKDRVVKTNAKPWASSMVTPNAWGHSEGIPINDWDSTAESEMNSGNNWGQAVGSREVIEKVNHQPNRELEAAYMEPPCAIPPPLQHGWQWANKGGDDEANTKADDALDDDDEELPDDSEDDITDDYDSDASEKSHETRKENRWLKPLFDILDTMTVEQINDHDRRWHCPACSNGPGAIDWFRGLQPLVTHAKTKGTRRVKLHRELAALLEEELQRRGTLVVSAGEVFGKWKGLYEMTADHEIVWPPMVVIMNTLFEKDDNDKWIGMGNQELVDYFSNYAALRARHSYGPNEHQGISILIFESSAMGYLEAERLHKQFADEGRDRDAWERHRVLLYPGGKRQLYGFLARKEDIDLFNKQSAGKSCLKFETKSYQEMVVIPMQKMSENDHKLSWYMVKADKQEQHCKAIQETFGLVTQKLRETMDENRVIRLRTKMQFEENKEEMDYQDCFFKEQMEKNHKVAEEKEQKLELLLQQEHARALQSVRDFGTDEDHKRRKEEIASFISKQLKGEEFDAREKLIQTHEQKKVDLKHRHLEEEAELEKEFHEALARLMEELTPVTF